MGLPPTSAVCCSEAESLAPAVAEAVGVAAPCPATADGLPPQAPRPTAATAAAITIESFISHSPASGSMPIRQNKLRTFADLCPDLRCAINDCAASGGSLWPTKECC